MNEQTKAEEATPVRIDGRAVFHEKPEEAVNRLGETLRFVRKWGKVFTAMGAAAVAAVTISVVNHDAPPPVAARSVIEYAPTPATLPESERIWAQNYRRVQDEVNDRLRPDSTKGMPVFLGTIKVSSSDGPFYEVSRPIMFDDKDVFLPGYNNKPGAAPDDPFDFKPFAFVSNDSDLAFDLGVYFMDDPFEYDFLDLDGQSVATEDLMKHVVTVGGARQVSDSQTNGYDIVVSNDIVVARGDSGPSNV